MRRRFVSAGAVTFCADAANSLGGGRNQAAALAHIRAKLKKWEIVL
jgi:hypothetical protein